MAGTDMPGSSEDDEWMLRVASVKFVAYLEGNGREETGWQQRFSASAGMETRKERKT